MDINKYLHCNNVALIDPQEEFHASCIKQFNTKGYLTVNQLISLRNWVHSASAIERLTTNADVVERTTTTVEPMTAKVTSAAMSHKAWTKESVSTLLDHLESGITSLKDLAKLMSRTESSVANALYKNGDCTIRRGSVLHFEAIPF